MSKRLSLLMVMVIAAITVLLPLLHTHAATHEEIISQESKQIKKAWEYVKSRSKYTNDQKESLVGLQDIDLRVGSFGIPEDIYEEIDSKAEKELRKNKIPELHNIQVGTPMGDLKLDINVIDVIPSPPTKEPLIETNLCNISLQLSQEVLLTSRDMPISASVVTWEKKWDGIITTDNLKTELQSEVDKLIKAFIDDYLSVNTKTGTN